jgi:hypothetical protein
MHSTEPMLAAFFDMLTNRDPKTQRAYCSTVQDFIAWLTPTRYVEVRRRFLREHPGHVLDGWPLPTD